MNSGGIFDLDSKQFELDRLQKKSTQSDFWNDNQSASVVLQKISRLEKEIAVWQDLERRHGDVEVLLEFAEAGESSLDEVANELRAYETIIQDLELRLMLGAKEDVQNAILTIHPGAGGTESQDWAEMLYRMYTRWMELTISNIRYWTINRVMKRGLRT